MANVVIRPERPDHAQAVALLSELDAYLASLYPPEANHILDVEALLAPEVSFHAAWNDDAMVGCCAVRRMPGEAATGNRSYGEIKRMYVRKQHRRQGIGERLLASLEARLQADGIGLSLLETGVAQPESLRLYERTGYRRRPPFGGYADNGLSLFYEKTLP